MTATAQPDTTTAAADLRELREAWGDLLAAIERPPAAEWPPRETANFLHQGADEQTGRPAVGRVPLVLREHPAPADLAALDAAVMIERALFDLADRIAAAVQRPARDDTDRADRDRWHTTTVRDALLPHAARGLLTATDPRTDDDRAAEILRGRPRVKGRPEAAAGASIAVASVGSRAHGLHWCAVWIEDRLGQTSATDLHTPVRGVMREHAAEVAAEAVRIQRAALGRDGRATVLPGPCPWCGGELTARTRSGDPMAAVVTCGTGPTCTAPTPYDDRARRHWRGADLVGLYAALAAGERRASA